MIDRKNLVAHLLLRKEAGAGRKALSALIGAGKGYAGIGKKISEEMGKAGVKSRLAHETARLLPAGAAALGAGAAYTSDRGKRTRYRIAMWKQKRRMKKAMKAQRRGRR
jgi:hypothetical protein